eukprot:TRINITY_DN974_c0_g1_i3.p3 TRINITY_DN974_c0_g1~~TRINITY_DN974_c0_g1_i3.p3  ORF type:complete len:389 (+),score=129.08 TRINITY_DN974_c0_g1_i3:2575-3741(+)
MSIKEFVATGEGAWAEFRKLEAEILEDLVKNNPVGAVIATGGGIVETGSAHSFLSSCGLPVIHLSRNMVDVLEALKDEKRAQLADDVDTLWKRREPLYRSAAEYEFHIYGMPKEQKEQEREWKKVTASFVRFVEKIIANYGKKEEEKEKKQEEESFFVCLTYPDVRKAVPLINDIASGSQAIELRVDLLACRSVAYVKEQVSLLKAYTSLPIIYTLRTSEQGGAFNGSEEEAYSLLELGLKMQCEYLDVEASLATSVLTKLAEKKGNTKIIASLHDYKNSVTQEQLQGLFQRCLETPGRDIVKVVGFAKSENDVYTLQHVRNTLGYPVPVIAILAGPEGSLSRVLNRFMTPVTHPLLPHKAAPGQLTVKEISQVRSLVFPAREHHHTQ